jgi:hypothetical protein
MKTKESFSWARTFSSTGSIEVPAGAPVEYNAINKAYYVKPTYFSNLIHQHDAIHYGCRVDPANIEGGEICGGCKHLKDKPSLHCGLSGLNLTRTLERSDYCKTHKQFQARD